MKHEKDIKPVEAIFVKVLENKPKGESVKEIKRITGNEFGGKVWIIITLTKFPISLLLFPRP